MLEVDLRRRKDRTRRTKAIHTDELRQAKGMEILKAMDERRRATNPAQVYQVIRAWGGAWAEEVEAEWALVLRGCKRGCRRESQSCPAQDKHGISRLRRVRRISIRLAICELVLSIAFRFRQLIGKRRCFSCGLQPWNVRKRLLSHAEWQFCVDSTAIRGLSKGSNIIIRSAAYLGKNLGTWSHRMELH